MKELEVAKNKERSALSNTVPGNTFHHTIQIHIFNSFLFYSKVTGLIVSAFTRLDRELRDVLALWDRQFDIEAIEKVVANEKPPPPLRLLEMVRIDKNVFYLHIINK